MIMFVFVQNMAYPFCQGCVIQRHCLGVVIFFGIATNHQLHFHVHLANLDSMYVI